MDGDAWMTMTDNNHLHFHHVPRLGPNPSWRHPGALGTLDCDSCGCESPGNRMNSASLHNFYKATIWIFESLVPKFMGQFFRVAASKSALGLSFVFTEKNPFIRALKTSSVLHVSWCWPPFWAKDLLLKGPPYPATGLQVVPRNDAKMQPGTCWV